MRLRGRKTDVCSVLAPACVCDSIQTFKVYRVSIDVVKDMLNRMDR